MSEALVAPKLYERAISSRHGVRLYREVSDMENVQLAQEILFDELYDGIVPLSPDSLDSGLTLLGRFETARIARDHRLAEPIGAGTLAAALKPITSQSISRPCISETRRFVMIQPGGPERMLIGLDLSTDGRHKTVRNLGRRAVNQLSDLENNWQPQRFVLPIARLVKPELAAAARFDLPEPLPISLGRVKLRLLN